MTTVNVQMVVTAGEAVGRSSCWLSSPSAGDHPIPPCSVTPLAVPTRIVAPLKVICLFGPARAVSGAAGAQGRTS